MNSKQVAIGFCMVVALVAIMWFEWDIYYIFSGGLKVVDPYFGAQATAMKKMLQITVVILGSLLMYVFRD